MPEEKPKLFEDYEGEAYDNFRDAGEVGLVTTAKMHAIQTMLNDLATQLHELKKEIKELKAKS